MRPWQIGNTTVRTPYRLKEALHALKNSEFYGNLLGKEQESGFAKLLNDKTIVNVDRLNRKEDDDVSDLGRKWRSALAQLGFVVIHLKKKPTKGIDPQIEYLVTDFPTLTGRPYEITPNGNRLIRAESAAEQQECFLRALAAYRLPTIIEPKYQFNRFSPLLFVLEILLNLEKTGDEPVIKFEEMVFVVQCRTPDDGFADVVSELLSYRHERKKSKTKKKFDEAKYSEIGTRIKVKPGTLIDYADLNFRYLKAAGLFRATGRGIALLPEKRTLVDFLVAGKHDIVTDGTYTKNLWNGAQLPTDSKIEAVKIIENLIEQLEARGETVTMPGLLEFPLDEITRRRHHLEERLRYLKESDYADEQAHLWEEIAESMNALKNRKDKSVFQDGEIIKIRGGEAPAYFEWITWRAFLAMDSLVNMPWEARRFKVDQDFLPLSHAPGGGPDMVFEFEEFVLVVEVTLMSSSRQEAAEGETVRRHVADIAEKFENTDKRVYCLFISPTINSNTAETFKIGNWYKKDDTRLPLQIVPLPLADFISLFRALFRSGKSDPSKLKQLIIECRALSNQDAPEWKREIKTETKRFISKL